MFLTKALLKDPLRETCSTNKLKKKKMNQMVWRWNKFNFRYVRRYIYKGLRFQRETFVKYCNGNFFRECEITSFIFHLLCGNSSSSPAKVLKLERNSFVRLGQVITHLKIKSLNPVLSIHEYRILFYTTCVHGKTRMRVFAKFHT